jgi:type I site-specific restriction endonuclease
MNEANENEKTIIFCATQEHAALVRDLVNQNKKQSKNSNYCVRVTANDGEIGEQFLREFQDNEKLIPTVLTTSQKLSTGVDARNIRNIVLMRPVNQMIEFKQIVGRGTRLYDAKQTIFVLLNEKQKEFIAFVLSQYIEMGVEELSQEKLPILLTNKYQSLEDAKKILGDVASISALFIEFQKYLYMQKAA